MEEKVCLGSIQVDRREVQMNPETKNALILVLLSDMVLQLTWHVGLLSLLSEHKLASFSVHELFSLIPIN